MENRVPNEFEESKRGVTPEVQEAQQWYSAAELAALLQVRPQLIYYFANKRQIQSDKSKRPYKFRASVDFIANHRDLRSLSAKSGTHETSPPRLSRFWRLRTTWQEFVDDPNRHRLIQWLGVVGSLASLIGLYFAFFPRPLSDDPVVQINNYMKTLVQQRNSSEPGSETELVKQIASAIESTCESAGDIDRAVSAVQAYLPRRNPTVLRTTAALVLAQLAREQKKGTIKKAKAGFLRAADLSSLDLSGCDLSDADLVGADLTDTNLRQCRIEEADLSNARIIRTNLSSTVSGRSIFDGARMKDCTFDNAILAESSMRKAQQEQCSFSGATIFATDFEGTHFQQSTFHNTNIIASRFKGIRSVGIVFQSGTTHCGRGEGLDFSTAHFNWKPTLKDNEKVKTTIFPSLNRYSMEFAPQDNTTFEDAILNYADFSRTCLQGIDFARAALKGAAFDGANLDRADLNQADLECTSFRGAILKSTRNLVDVKNASAMDFNGSAITKIQASTLQSHGALYSASQTIAKQFANSSRCDPIAADVASPLPKWNNASEYETHFDLVPYPDSPTEPHAAVEFFSRILEQKPNDVASLSKRGKARYELGQIDEAIADLQRVLEIEPHNSGAFCNLGFMYNSKNKPQVALEVLSQALEQPIGDRELHAVCTNNRGVSYRLLGKFDQAIIEFDRAIALDPNQVNAYFNRASVHEVLKEYELAIQDYTFVLKTDPKFIDAYRGRSAAYHSLGQSDLANADERAAREVEKEQNH